MKLAEAIARDPLGLPGQYLSKCPGASAERAEVADVLKRILQSATDDEDDPLRHVPAWFKPKSTRPWVVEGGSGQP
jgi:hypothetical protein